MSPRTGFVIVSDKSELVVSNSIIFSKSKILSIPVSRVLNETNYKLVKGDEILYQIENEEHKNQITIKVKKVRAR